MCVCVLCIFKDCMRTFIRCYHSRLPLQCSMEQVPRTKCTGEVLYPVSVYAPSSNLYVVLLCIPLCNDMTSILEGVYM